MTPEFRTDGVFDVYEMLDAMRPRPAMYLDEPSLTRLWWLLLGYEWALHDHDIAFREVGPFNTKFHHHVRMHFGLPPNTQGYAPMILEQCDGDEARALRMFFELLDKFRQQEDL